MTCLLVLGQVSFRHAEITAIWWWPVFCPIRN